MTNNDIIGHLAEAPGSLACPSRSSRPPSLKDLLIPCQKLKIKNLLVPLEKHPRLLGVTFDTMHTFNQHAKLTASKASKKINILKSLAGSTWGQSKETLILTYKSICRSVLEYAAPVWAPAISKSRWSDLQTVQNSALRIATGSLLMTNIDHLHIETKVLLLVSPSLS